VWCFIAHIYVCTVHSHLGHDLFLYTGICIYIYIYLWFLVVFHGAFGNESWCSRGAFLCVTWLIELCGFLRFFMVYFYVWRDSFLTCGVACISMWWLIPMCDVTYSYVWRGSFICVTWLIPMCGMTHCYVWHDSSLCVIWLISMREAMHSCVWHDSFICVTWLI